MGAPRRVPNRSQFGQGPAYALLGGIVAETERGTDGAKIHLLDVMKQHGITIMRIQAGQRRVEQWTELLPFGWWIGH